ncbi:hypothetical protein HFO56_33870 [Rhizobium laguerreae]|uniref:hypothetical protein n=1 Tax=Rhizobium laguerreae TaxID=1076926 RepID=UPI001C9105D0|nr:hypothetical protein [Rhizobium laguerreae]MBY3157316.1 hypothetical protein [Rhizobium laguerreae]
MARSNSPASLENWKAKADRAIYRASVGPNTYWEGNRPAPDLAVAAKVCPGGRMLMAFEFEELRDYFVEGHADNGGQREPDGCDRASPFRPVARNDLPLPAYLESSIPAYLTARKALVDSHSEIERVFNVPFQIALDSDKVRTAISMINAMPDTHLRSVAISKLLDSKKWDTEKKPIWQIEAAPYSRKQAAALVRWQRAKKSERVAEDIHGEFAMDRAQAILEQEGEEALKAFAATLPPSVTRAYISVMGRRTSDRGQPSAAGPKM